jgi:hypothetical protein
MQKQLNAFTPHIHINTLNIRDFCVLHVLATYDGKDDSSDLQSFFKQIESAINGSADGTENPPPPRLDQAVAAQQPVSSQTISPPSAASSAPTLPDDTSASPSPINTPSPVSSPPLSQGAANGYVGQWVGKGLTVTVECDSGKYSMIASVNGDHTLDFKIIGDALVFLWSRNGEVMVLSTASDGVTTLSCYPSAAKADWDQGHLPTSAPRWHKRMKRSDQP